jgi:hypothetical protein
MSKVVYRGQPYDTEQRRESLKQLQQEQWFSEIYRGIKFEKTLFREKKK